MANKQAPNQPGSTPGQPNPDQDPSGSTFKTDVSETDDEGTTVREAEVREDDMTEVDRSKEQGHG